MEGFTLIDGIVAVIIVVSAILAYSRGLVRETLAIGGWVLAAVVAYFFAADVQPLMGEIPILGEFLGDSFELSMIAAFAAVFAVTLVVVSIFTPLFAGAVQRSALGGVDQGLGFLFGVLRGVLLVVVALVVYDRLIIADPVPMIDDSRTAKLFAEISDNVDDAIPEDAPGWLVQRYEEFMAGGGTGSEGFIQPPETTPDATPETAPETGEGETATDEAPASE